MNGRTHDLVAKMMFPNLTFKKIRSVNSLIDNPSRRAVALGDAFNTIYAPDGKGSIKPTYFNPFDVFGLAKSSPHRRVNHDVMSASVMSFMEHGYPGILLAMLHLHLDSTSEQWKKMFGHSRSMLQEAMLNVAIENMIDKRRVKSQPIY